MIKLKHTLNRESYKRQFAKTNVAKGFLATDQKAERPDLSDQLKSIVNSINSRSRSNFSGTTRYPGNTESPF